MKKSWKALVLLLPFLVLVTMFELLPLFMTFLKSLQPESGGIGLDNFVLLFTKKYYLNSIRNSVAISLQSSLIGLSVAFAGALAAHHASGRVKDAFGTLLNITSNFAGIPLAIAYIVLIGNTGILVNLGKLYGITWLADYNLYSIKGLGLIYVYFQIPVSILLMMPAFEGIRKEWLESALLLKASRFQFWLRVGIPVILPSLLGTFCFLFANSMSAYATAYALLGSNFSLMTTVISSMISGDVYPKYGLGSALSIVMVLIIGASVLLNNKLLQSDGKEKVP